MGDDALLARIHLIRNATESIEIQTFIWAPDESGQFVFWELYQAALRGVQVRIIIDDLSIRAIHNVVAYLTELHPNIEIKQYNPVADDIDINVLERVGELATGFGKYNHRMHNKIVIVDGTYGITGGRNYENDYFDRGTDRSFLDRDILVLGPVVEQMVTSFEDYWADDLSVPTSKMKDVRKEIQNNKVEIPDIAAAYQIPFIFDELSKCASSAECVEERIVNRGIQLNEVIFVADHPGKHNDGDDLAETTESLIELITSARKRMIFQTPYLVAGPRGNEAWRDIRKNNPDMQILVSSNSLAAADHFYAYAFSYKNKKKYLKQYQWKIHEMKPSPPDIDQMMVKVPGVEQSDKHYACIHAKTFLFDDDVVWLGSFNLDPRSARLNTEAGVIIRDREFFEMVEERIMLFAAPQNAWTIAPRQKIPIVSFLNGVIENIFSLIPFANVWPFTYAASYELREGGNVVPFHSREFHDNYRSVGQFPGVEMTPKAIKTRLTKAFFGPAQPII
jgi:phosphatidylserine/phosphatidylglycerophosphate/cardiolipin synthase-like enzyme